MKLIAFTGKAGSGKDTAANVLAKRDFVRIAFADALKRSCMEKFDLSYDDVFTQEGKRRFVPAWGLTVREILQREGTEGTKSVWGDDFWVRRWELERRAFKEQGFEHVVVTDLRFLNEARHIHACGGIVVEIVRPDAEGLPASQAAHASEQPLPPALVDHTIINNSTKAHLHDEVLSLLCVEARDES